MGSPCVAARGQTDLSTNRELCGKLERRRSSFTMVDGPWTPQVLASLLGTGNIPGD